MNTLVFDDVSEASLMTLYTGGTVYKRQALLSLNLQGGGGFEIWQFLNRQPTEPSMLPQVGDLGIYAPKLKCADVTKAHNAFLQQQNISVSLIQHDPKGDAHFWVQDEYHNVFQVVSGNHWFQQAGKAMGGVTGAVIGVSNMDRSLAFYQSLLNVDRVVYDKTEVSRKWL
jgi:hypothetical protein